MSKTSKSVDSALIVTGNASAAPVGKAPTKTSTVLKLLQREQGATITELIEATGWQPHTTRAALTGLRKMGHAIERGKRGDVTSYHLSGAEA
jgi:Protein of unknown function (DUF3489)